MKLVTIDAMQEACVDRSSVQIDALQEARVTVAVCEIFCDDLEVSPN